MNAGLIGMVCAACGRAAFPPRLRCAACGGAAWRPERVEEGIVEEVTTVHRAVGVAGETPVSLASVRLDAGPVVIARLDGEAAVGGRVELVAEQGAPIASCRLRAPEVRSSEP